MNRHPMLGVCGAFALGILLDYSFNIPVCLLLVLTSISLLSFFVLLYLRAALHFCVAGGAFLVSMTGASYYHYSYFHYPVNHISRLVTTEKTPACLQGIVDSSPTVKMSDSSQTVERTSFSLKAGAIKNEDRWDSVSGTVRVNANSPEAIAIKYGDRVELLGNIFAPSPPHNPGQWDYREYLRRQRPRITAIMVITDPLNIKVISRGNGNPFFAFIDFIKERLIGVINGCCTPDSAAIVTGMVLGDRQNIPEDVMDAFEKTGTIHFLAISGFNVGILVIAAYTIFRLLCINKRVSAGAMILFVMLYAVLTGRFPSALRACLMASVYFGAILLNRRWDLLNGIAIAVLIILIRNPSELFDAGLQLSVLGVLGIVCVSNGIEGSLWKGTLLVERLQVPEERSKFWFFWRYIRKNLCMSLGAWLAVMPLIAHYFHIATPSVVFLNIILFPLIWIIIVGGLIVLMAGAIHPLLAVPAAYLIHYSNLIMGWLISFFASKEMTFLYTPGPAWLWVSVYYATGVMLIWHKELRLRLAHVIILILVCGNIFFFWGDFGQRNKDLRLTCLSVGHGGAIFVEFPNGKNLLFDAGGGGKLDIGESIIPPFLWERGIKKIDLVVLSHEHADHTNALPSLIERFGIDAVLTNKFFPQSDTGLSLNNVGAGLPRPYLLNDKDIEHSVVSLGTSISGFGEAELTILGPPEEGLLSPNDSSCALRIKYAGRTLLLLADIKEAGIASLLYNFNDLKADIIQVPHHGFRIANTDKLVNKVQPLYAFINSGARTVSEKTLNEYLKNGTEVFQTHRSGAITITINRHGTINISTFR